LVLFGARYRGVHPAARRLQRCVRPAGGGL